MLNRDCGVVLFSLRGEVTTLPVLLQTPEGFLDLFDAVLEIA